MLKRVFEFRVVVPVRNKVCYMFVPASLRLDEVIYCQLEVIARRVDAPHHDLVTQYEVPHKLRAIYFQRPVTRWYAGHYVRSIDGQCIDEVEFETGDSCRLKDQVERIDVVGEVIRRNLTSIDVMTADQM